MYIGIIQSNLRKVGHTGQVLAFHLDHPKLVMLGRWPLGKILARIQ